MPTTATLRRGLMLIVMAAALWGTTGLTSTVLYRLSKVDPLSVGFLRLVTASPARLVMARAAAPGSLWPVLQREWRAVLLLGLSMAGYNASFFAAIARTSVTAATLLAICTAPLLVAVLARIFLTERLTRSVLLALAAGFAGAVLLVGGQARADALRLNDALGNLLALSAALSYAVYALVGRAASRESPPATLAALSFTAAAAWLAPFALANGLRLPTNLAAWLAVLYLGWVPTALAYLFYFTGLRTVPATVASISTLVEYPVNLAVMDTPSRCKLDPGHRRPSVPSRRGTSR